MGFRLWELTVGVASAVLLGSAQVDAAQIKSLNPPRIPAVLPVRTDLPRRDAPIRIAALRVEFQRDTLSTTTGDGSFAYSRLDSLYASFDDTTNIFFDPAPHDSLYFADQLQFQQFYWEKMSNGAVVMEWDIFPAGAQVAYQLPKQMWQYNHNNGDAQLDHGLSELFRDAVVSADADPAVMWQNYDLVMIFHAGAGAEFDLGYTTTPHDIPSAWMVPEDFRTQLNLPDGIPVDGGTRYVNNGIILPETESHEGVQISVAGVITLMIGHWMGLPALYDRDDGKAVVGKWSMMDRGFGNFYGALPGPVDAWSANKMGWMNLQEVVADTNRITARFQLAHPSDPDPVRGLRITISDQEEFILECRQRDPEGDSVAYAYDRDGRRMTFKDDYSVEVEPGFKVPVSAEDFDFDSPGTGILIWHHDKGLDNLISEGRFNSVNELRGLDFEEADGAQDIGQDYPLLTSGYGTDYGIYEDAWYGDNTAHKNANGGRFVSFNDESYPASRSNSGAFTHIKLDQFSRRAGVMSFRYARTGLIYRIAPPRYRGGATMLGRFIGAPESQQLAVFSDDSVRMYDNSGRQLSAYYLPDATDVTKDCLLSRDINGDGRDDLLFYGQRSLAGLISHPVAGFIYTPIRNADFEWISAIALGGDGLGSVLVEISSNPDTLYFRRFDSGLILSQETGFEYVPDLLPVHLARAGTATSDSFFVFTNDARLYLWTRGGLQLVQDRPAGLGDDHLESSSIQVADFDGSGKQDVAIPCNLPSRQVILYADPLKENPASPQILPLPHRSDCQIAMPCDIAGDGQYKFLGIQYRDNGFTVSALYPNLNLCEGYPQSVVEPVESSQNYEIMGMLNLGSEFLTAVVANPNSLYLVRLSGKVMTGFPLTVYQPHSIAFAELDSVPGNDLIVTSSYEITAHSLPTSNWHDQSVWWQGKYRDNDHSNAVWEPATSFSPAPSAPLMPSDLCYNWPNPASESTAIRFTLNFAATVKITIFDIAGDKVATLHGQGQAGVPNEIIWNLKDVARGGYLAVVEANGAGRSEKKTVKIAVKK